MIGLRFLLKHCTFLVSIIALCVGQVATLAQAQDYVAVEGTQVPDSVFLKKSHEVIFPVNRSILLPKYKKLLEDTVAVGLRHMGDSGVVLGRAAASPEGPLRFNKRLAISRMQSIKDYLEQLGVETTRIKFDTVYEDYQLLVEMMRQKKDPFYARVRDVVSAGKKDLQKIKKELQVADGGKIWEHVYKKYYPNLRAVRLMLAYQPKKSSPMLHGMPLYKFNPEITDYIIVGDPITIPYDDSDERRELLSIKTNLPMWGTYIPQYGGWCPLPNVAIEYYPAHGHWTYGMSYDNPWWIGNTTNHKYFEVRHYQLETRRYFRNSDLWYQEGGAAFQKWYLSAYADAGLYQVGFSASKGWIGEGGGFGFGAGYVMPFKCNPHWRLEFSAQVGYFVTKYDPYVYGCPVETVDDGFYYYNWTGKADLFRKRMHRFTWMGPTRVGITLSYDLLYRKKPKGVSFRRWEKGGLP